MWQRGKVTEGEGGEMRLELKEKIEMYIGELNEDIITLFDEY
jgi:hypothetical protein